MSDSVAKEAIKKHSALGNERLMLNA